MPEFLARRGIDFFESSDHPEEFVYMSKNEVDALCGCVDLEALCIDGLHYHVTFDVKEDEVHIHYPFWNKKFDMICPKEWLFEFYLAKRGKYSERQGIGPKNTYPGLYACNEGKVITHTAVIRREAEEAAKYKKPPSTKKRRSIPSEDNTINSPKKSKNRREPKDEIPAHVIDKLEKQWDPLEAVTRHSDNNFNEDDDSDITLTTSSTDDKPSFVSCVSVSHQLAFDADTISAMISRQMSKSDSVSQYQSDLQYVLSQISSLTAMREKTQRDIDSIMKKKLRLEKELHEKETAHLASQQTVIYLKRVIDGLPEGDSQARALLHTTIDCEEKLMAQFAAVMTALLESHDKNNQSLLEMQKAIKALDNRIKQVNSQKDGLYQQSGIQVATVVNDVLTKEMYPILLQHVSALFNQIK